MENVQELLLVLSPVIMIEIVLAIAALISIFKSDGYKRGSRMMWILIVVFIQIVGPISYFVLGKGDGYNNGYDT